MALCGLAFAGPRWGIQPTVVHSRGVDVVLALDASRSMLAQDVSPSRLEAMKALVQQLRAQSPNDRFALVAFAGHSYVLSPLTTDQQALDLYLTNLTPATVGVGGTSIADAIHQGTTLLRARRGDAGQAIVLMSDGESFEPLAAVTAAAKQAGEAGIRLITVGLGTKQGAVIPIQTPSGGRTVKHDSAGNVVITHYMPSVLQQAANAAVHGTFIPADTAGQQVVQIRHVLQQLSPAVRGTVSGDDLALRFQWIVLGSFLLLVLDTFVMLRPRRRRQVRRHQQPVPHQSPTAIGRTVGVTAVAPVIALLAASIVLLGGCGTEPAAPEQTAAPGVLQHDTAASARYNAGTKLLLQDSVVTLKALAEALPLLTQAQASPDSTVRFRATFNQGWDHLVTILQAIKILNAGGSRADSLLVIIAQAMGSQAAPGDSAAGSHSAQANHQQVARYLTEHVEQALTQYRTALLLHPSEKAAKWNYEIALRMLKTVRKEESGKKKKEEGKKKQQQKQQQKKQQQTKKKPNNKPKKPDEKPQKPKTGKTNQTPPVQRLQLPPQQAKQLLNAVGQHEQHAVKKVPVPAAPPAQGKDW
jgi:Ca-activated chloride channel family protein